jgi:polyhydroxybutyrate depolymerase
MSLRFPLLRAALLLALLPALRANAQPAGTLVFDTIAHAGLDRSFIVFEPAAWDGSSMLPLVLNLHGAGSTAIEQSVYSQLNNVADTAGFLVVLPDAIDNFWNSGIGSLPGAPDDVAFLGALIDTISGRYPVDQDRVYSTGMSNGGYMSYRLACETPERLAAIASVTGSMAMGIFASCNPSESVPVFQIHGTADSTVPYLGADFSAPVEDVVALWAGANECPGEAIIEALPDPAADNCTVESRRWIGCRDWSEVLFYAIEGGGHTWPGSFPLPGAGNTCQDFRANQAVWAFFRRHDRSQRWTGLSAAALPEGPAPVPNPGRDGLWLDGAEGLAVTLHDALGRPLRQAVAGGARWRWDLPGLPAGTYYVRVAGRAARPWVVLP